MTKIKEGKMAETDNSAVLEVSSQPKSTMFSRHDSKDTDVMSNNSISFESSLVGSRSVESFCSVTEQDSTEYVLDERDLQVRVDNPQKHLDTLETYITFRITTKTSRAEFDEAEYVVRRRYNDFLWLRQRLVEAFPTHLIPPLPGKHSLIAQLDRYSKEFILARMALLHRFLNRVANHPILSCYQSVKVFLTAKPSEFSIHRKVRYNLLGRVSTSLHNIASSLVTRQQVTEFDKTRDYVAVLGEKLSCMDKISQRIHKERLEYCQELSQLPPLLTLWSTSESELSPLLLAMAAAVEQQAAAQRLTVAAFSSDLAQPLAEYRLYVDAVREALSRRDAAQQEAEGAAEELRRRREEREQLLSTNQSGSSGGLGFASAMLWKGAVEGKEEKLQKLAQSIPALVKQVEEKEDKMECANENLRSDIERWHVEKRNDLKQLFLTLANQQIKCYEESLTAWEGVLPTCEASKSLHSPS